MSLHRTTNYSSRKNPGILLVFSFIAIILTGALLLMLPYARTVPLTFINALFMSASATCVTGLSVIDVAHDLTRFGQIVLLILAEVGGIGLMTFVAFFMMMLGRKISSKDETMLTNSVGGESSSLKTILITAVIFSILTEAIGSYLFYLYFRANSIPSPLYYGVFHAISSFCNAGFTLFPNSMTEATRPILLISATMLLLGGLGFQVVTSILHYNPLCKNRLKKGRIPTHAKLILWTTLWTILIGTISFLLLEQNTVLSNATIQEKITISFYQTVSSRTAGFAAVNPESLSVPTQFFTMVLMFIGGAPGSTAGGIKVTTAALLVITMYSILTRQSEITIHKRTISEKSIHEAIAVFSLSIIIVILIFGTLLVTENPDGTTSQSVKLLFETISAFSTNGLTLNYTQKLTPIGRLVITIAMFIGRLGPISLVLALSNSNQKRKNIHYPQEGVMIG